MEAIYAWNALAQLRAERDAAVEAAYREGYATGHADRRMGPQLLPNVSWRDSDARKALGVSVDSGMRGFADAQDGEIVKLRARIRELEAQLADVTAERNELRDIIRDSMFRLGMTQSIAKALPHKDKDMPYWIDENTKEMIRAQDEEKRLTAMYLSLRKQVEGFERVVEALDALVKLKDYKDTHGKDDTYDTLRPRLWKNASAALAALPTGEKEEGR